MNIVRYSAMYTYMHVYYIGDHFEAFKLKKLIFI